MNVTVLLMYLGTWALVALAPGPAVMCAMSQATRFGFRHSWAGIAGIQLGHLVFFACAASGLTALLASAATTFQALRILGAAYLFYLGVRTIASTFREHPTETQQPNPPSRRSLLVQGLAIQVTNPKALLFMSALLPQFIQPEFPIGHQLGLLLGATIGVDCIVLAGYAYLASRGVHSMKATRFQTWLERLFGSALIIFGARLLTARK